MRLGCCARAVASASMRSSTVVTNLYWKATMLMSLSLFFRHSGRRDSVAVADWSAYRNGSGCAAMLFFRDQQKTRGPWNELRSSSSASAHKLIESHHAVAASGDLGRTMSGGPWLRRLDDCSFLPYIGINTWPIISETLICWFSWPSCDSKRKTPTA